MEQKTNKKAVILLSGGLDSVTTLALINDMQYEIYALSFDYGQKHKFELFYAKKIAKQYKVKKHIIIELNKEFFESSALVNSNVVLCVAKIFL